MRARQVRTRPHEDERRGKGKDRSSTESEMGEGKTEVVRLPRDQDAYCFPILSISLCSAKESRVASGRLKKRLIRLSSRMKA
jgi:hypothetical protein